jgi:ZIP family zinc transporter
MLTILFISFVAGTATLAGSGAVMVGGRPSQRSLALFLGAAAGIMTGVVVFDLLPSAYSYGSLTGTVAGFSLGVLMLLVLDNLFRAIMGRFGTVRYNNVYFRMGVMIAVGIALHDFPEGIAIAAGYSAETDLGLLIAIAITLHNIPEGMACTVPLWLGGLRRRHIVMMMAFVSLITPVGTLAGYWLFSISPGLLSLLLAFAAGAMAYIVLVELIPQGLRCGKAAAAAGAAAGLGLIQILSMI